jgi:hypothetical protein
LLFGYSSLADFDYSTVLIRTFIHCSVRRIDSKLQRQVLDYSTQGAYLLRRSLGDLQFLGDALACHIARSPWRCGETSLQASRRIIYEGHNGQSRTAEPGPQLEPLLKRFPILLVDVSSMVMVSSPSPTSRRSLPLPLPSSGISSSRGGEAGSDTNFVSSSYKQIVWVSSTTTTQ